MCVGDESSGNKIMKSWRLMEQFYNFYKGFFLGIIIV
jgi:hypothetical protein